MVNASSCSGWTTTGRTSSTEQSPGAIDQGIEDRHLPHHDALPRHRAVSKDGRRRTAPSQRLAALRHPPRSLPARRDDRTAAGNRLLARVQGFLPMDVDHPRRPQQKRPARPAPHLAYAGGWKSSNQCGTPSSAHGRSCTCSPCSKPCSHPSADDRDERPHLNRSRTGRHTSHPRTPGSPSAVRDLELLRSTLPQRSVCGANQRRRTLLDVTPGWPSPQAASASHVEAVSQLRR